MKKLFLKKIGEGMYFYDTWNHDLMFIIGEYLLSNVMIFPQDFIDSIQKINDIYVSNTYSAEYTKNGVKIESTLEDEDSITMPYDKFIRMLKKWKSFLDSNDEPDILVITMDNQYNIEFSYEWDGVTKKFNNSCAHHG